VYPLIARIGTQVQQSPYLRPDFLSAFIGDMPGNRSAAMALLYGITSTFQDHEMQMLLAGEHPTLEKLRRHFARSTVA
jgi:hypothetical protein